MFTCLLFAVVIAIASAQKFSTQGNKIYYNDEWITFNGIGLTCTEYMMKPEMDSLNPYPGYWAYNSCFGGPSSKGGPIELNKEPENVLNYLKGDNYIRQPNIKKVAFKSPYDQVIDATQSPNHFPIVRMPLTASCYLYDQDVDTGHHADYVDTIDAIVEFFTNNSVAVVLDLHWNCPDDSAISGCKGAQSSPMALKMFGSNPGAVTFWSTISKKYANNPLVLYELFNEPWLQPQDWLSYYAGDGTYAGMKQMYEAVRANTDNLIIIGGAQSYALDAQTLLSFWIQYGLDNNGQYPKNVIFNHHPYQGAGQGLEHSPQSVMRFALASKTVAPVIFTEFGQYCCGTKGTPCSGGTCTAHATGDNFVFNIVNMCLEYDISWIGWAWRGTNDDYPCGSKPDCNQPDMRNTDGTIVDGSYGGADWKTVWETFVSAQSPQVQDAANGETLAPNQSEDAGYLVRPCIQGKYNLGGICGWDEAVATTDLTVHNLTDQSIYDSILPGLPPNGSCSSQGCAGIQCQTYTGPCQGQ